MTSEMTTGSDRVANAKAAGTSAMWIGIAHVLLGILAVAAPFASGLAVAIVVGVFVLIAGVIQGFVAYQEKSWGKGLIAVLYVVAGVLLLMRPMLTLATLTLFVAAWFLALGVWRLLAGIRFEDGRWWNIFGAVVAIALGVMLMAKWPLSSTYAIGVLVGIEILFSGIMMLTVGSAMRGVAKDVQEARDAVADR